MDREVWGGGALLCETAIGASFAFMIRLCPSLFPRLFRLNKPRKRKRHHFKLYCDMRLKRFHRGRANLETGRQEKREKPAAIVEGGKKEKKKFSLGRNKIARPP